MCVICNTEKSTDNFYSKYRECKPCKIQRNMKRYYENKEKISNQRNLFYEKKRNVLIAKSKLNQQNRKYERKKYKQKVEEVNKRLEDLTQAIEKLKVPNSQMTQKTNKTLLNEIFSQPPKKKYATNKTDVYHIDEFWSLDILDLNENGPENKRRYRYVLVIKDNFSKFGWTVPLKNKNAQTIKTFFENILINSQRKPNLIETDRGKEFYILKIQDFPNKKKIRHYSRNTYLGAVFAERFNRTIRDLLKRHVF